MWNTKDFVVQTFIYFEKPQEGSGGAFVDLTLRLSDYSIWFTLEKSY